MYRHDHMSTKMLSEATNSNFNSMIEISPITSFDTAAIPPALNITPIYGSFKSAEPMTSPQHLITNITEFLFAHPECPFADNISHDFGNLDAAGPVTSQEAIDVLVQIANHKCAYGNKISTEQDHKSALVHATFCSMQGSSFDPKAVWYATTDVEVCQKVCPSYFSSPYIADWISFVVICLQGDGRTCSILLGADTD